MIWWWLHYCIDLIDNDDMSSWWGREDFDLPKFSLIRMRLFWYIYVSFGISFDLSTSLLIYLRLIWQRGHVLMMRTWGLWFTQVFFNTYASLLVYLRLFWYIYVSFDICTSLLIYPRLFIMRTRSDDEDVRTCAHPIGSIPRDEKTWIYQKRRTYIKRDVHISKET